MKLLDTSKICNNTSFPSSPGALFQNEGTCSAFVMEIIFHSHANKSHYYIHTKKYSPSYLVNFRTQISSSQSEERTMVFTRGKNDTSNQKPQRCASFAPKFPPFIAACTHSTRKVLLQEFFSLKKWKTFRKWSGIVSFVSQSIKKTVERSRRNNSGKG